MIALGGGVIGDLAGFAAATYMRGVGLVQCPTTLLAMVDSSVGGKTGVDLPQGKNLVGAFKQPEVVIADTAALASLPDKEIQNGMAELIKHAILDDPELFASMEASPSVNRPDTKVIARSVSVKIRTVEADPLESGVRATLNLGHTTGHALEKCSRYGMAHGAAVSVGLLAAAKISALMNMCLSDIPARIESVLGKAGLPVRHNLDTEDLISAMASDKKTVAGRPRFVLIKDIGKVEHGLDVPPKILRQALNELGN